MTHNNVTVQRPSLTDNHRDVLWTLSLIKGDVPLKSLSDAVVGDLVIEPGSGRTPHQQLLVVLTELADWGLVEQAHVRDVWALAHFRISGPGPAERLVALTTAGYAMASALRAA